MKFSLSWVRDYVDLPVGIDITVLAHDITLKTVEVEAWSNPGDRLAHVVVAQVTDVAPLDDQGVRLSCTIGAAETVTVVSRVTDLTPGQMLALALPGAQLTPRGGNAIRDVSAARVMGIDSHGVLVSPIDVGLTGLFRGGDTGLLDTTELDVPAGTPLADAVGYDDWVLEVDNKSLTNRPDLWGHYGMARELAAIYGLPLRPLPAGSLPATVEGLVGELDPALCRRFVAMSFDLGQHGPAPLWMRSRLSRIGETPRGLCVDLSNYVMHTVGQPTHVYDADHVTLPLCVRPAAAAVKVDLIAGYIREVEPGIPVIADAFGPVAIAGVIGGADSAVTDTSRRFVLEAANFRPQPIRRASQRLGIRTEASARFEKDLDTPRVDAAVGLFLHLLGELAPDVRLHGCQDVTVAASVPAVVDTNLDFLAARIGERLNADDVTTTLAALGFQVTVGSDGRLRITAPTWRSTGDISGPHDIVEEVARIRGYETILTAGLTVALKPVNQLHARPLDRMLRETLAAAGLYEVMTYPWAGDTLLAVTGHAKDITVRFDGAPAPDRDSLRPSLVPNLLEAVASNLRYRTDVGLFEVGAVFHAGADAAYHDRFEILPRQRRLLAAALTGTDGPTLFRRAKGVLEHLRRRAHLVDLTFSTDGAEMAVWADAGARLALSTEGRRVGTLGLLTNRARRNAGIAVPVVVFELDIDDLPNHTSRHNVYQPVPEFPDAEFDLSVVVNDAVVWADIATTATGVGPQVHAVEYVGEFRGSWVPIGHRSLSLRVTVRAQDRTLTADDIGQVRQAILDTLHTRHGAYLRTS